MPMDLSELTVKSIVATTYCTPPSPWSYPVITIATPLVSSNRRVEIGAPRPANGYSAVCVVEPSGQRLGEPAD
jgi:hypothetical protein